MSGGQRYNGCGQCGGAQQAQAEQRLRGWTGGRAQGLGGLCGGFERAAPADSGSRGDDDEEADDVREDRSTYRIQYEQLKAGPREGDLTARHCARPANGPFVLALLRSRVDPTTNDLGEQTGDALRLYLGDLRQSGRLGAPPDVCPSTVP